VPPENYYPQVQALLNKHGIMFWADEVITGFGRLGTPFAADYFDVVPDMLNFAKCVTNGVFPMGGVICREHMYEAMMSGPEHVVEFLHGYTYSGHPVACAAALKNIEIIEREELLKHVRDIEPYFQQRLKTLSDLPIVGDVRGIGLMACVEFVKDKESKELFSEELDIGKWVSNQADSRGLIVRPIINLNVMSPPLIINREQVDFIVDTLRDSIVACLEDLRLEGHL
jgi:adenosylmethionine-8-amino-7-oxononanoate aminotransferase